MIRTRCGAACSCGCTPMLADSTRSRRKTWRSARAALAMRRVSMAALLLGRRAVRVPRLHCRCCPPSSASICPVIAGRARMATTARADLVGAGAVAAAAPRPTAGRTASWVWRAFGSAGPGPMPLTRMRGASASAIDLGQRPQAGLGHGVGDEMRRQRPDPLVEHVDHHALGRRRQGGGRNAASARRARAGSARCARPRRRGWRRAIRRARTGWRC